jgi:hypothetical protein
MHKRRKWLLLGSLVYLSELPDRDQIVGSPIQDTQEFSARLFESAQIEEGTAKGNSRGQIRGMLCQPSLAHADGFLVVAGPTVLLGKLRKRNRRRIFLDPASKVCNPTVFGHPSIIG